MELTTVHLVALAGFGGGIILGLAARVGRFCTMGALEDAFLGHDYRRVRSWALAIAIAMAATQGMAALGLIDLTNTIYLAGAFPWLGAIIGGGLFGIGMALVGTCGYGTLARIGGGDLRAIVTFLVMGVSAYMAMNGLTAVARAQLFDPVTIAMSGTGGGLAFDTLFDAATGLESGHTIGLALALLIGVWALRDQDFRAERRLVLSGIAVGAVIAFGWAATGLIGQDPFSFQRLESFTFARPLGDTLIYVMTYTGATITFGIASVFGVVTGAFAGAVTKREFRWEACDDVRELRRHIVGAFLMGTGGVLAFGCTIGQGITAASTLSISAPIVIASIAFGSRIGMAWLIEGTLRGLFERYAYSREG